jgi:peptidoglycan glycosyltransferase
MTFMGAIAGGGSGAEPYFVADITAGGKHTYRAETVSTGRIMSAETAKTLQELMRNNVVVKYGIENFPDMTICAKSGTAEVGPEKEPHAMFSGFVTDEEYPLAFMVTVENAGSGRKTCVPIISKVLTACKEVMDAQ